MCWIYSLWFCGACLCVFVSCGCLFVLSACVLKNKKERERMELGKWEGSGRSWREEKHDQNILHENFFSVKEKKYFE